MKIKDFAVETIEVNKKDYKKLIELYKKVSCPNLKYLEIRRLQYLIKQNYTHADKQKLFGIINIYKNMEEDNKNIYLKTYLRNLLDKLENNIIPAV